MNPLHGILGALTSQLSSAYPYVACISWFDAKSALECSTGSLSDVLALRLKSCTEALACGKLSANTLTQLSAEADSLALQLTPKSNCLCSKPASK